MNAEDSGVLSDAELIQRYAATRNAGCFAELVARYRDMVYSAVVRVVRERASAEDVTQECFLRLAGSAGSIKSSVAAWLHTVAVNASIDALRQERSRRRREEQAADMTTHDEGEASWDEIKHEVHQAIERLPQKLRKPLVLHFLAGKRQSEVASELGVAQSTVSRRIEQGVARVREHLKEAGMVISVSALTTCLATETAEAAPAALVAALGKLALAGIPASPPSAAAVGSVLARIAAAGWKAKAVCVAMAVVVGGAGVHQVVSSGALSRSVPPSASAATKQTPAPEATTRAAAQSKRTEQADLSPLRPATVSRPLLLPAAVGTRVVQAQHAPSNHPMDMVTVTGRTVDEAGRPVASATATVVSHPAGREGLDPGLGALPILLRILGAPTPSGQWLRLVDDYNQRPSLTLSDLQTAAVRMGTELTIAHLSAEELAATQRPGIVHLEHGRFVTLVDAGPQGVRYLDGDLQMHVSSLPEFAAEFTGDCLLPAAQERRPGPHLIFDELDFDVGEVKPDLPFGVSYIIPNAREAAPELPVRHRFECRNVGPTPLRIEVGAASPGSRYSPPGPITIPPGGTSEMVVEGPIVGRRVIHWVELLTGDPSGPLKYLTVRAHCRRSVAVTPRAIGAVVQSGEAAAWRLWLSGPADLAVLEAYAKPDTVDVKADQGSARMAQQADLTVIPIIVTLSNNLTPGVLRGAVRITTNDPHWPSFEVPFVFDIR